MNELDLSSISDWELDLLIEIKKMGEKENGKHDRSLESVQR